MHKTHVVLEDWQYEALRTLAAQEHRSISDLVREMLTRHLAGNREIARQRLAEPGCERSARRILADAGSVSARTLGVSHRVAGRCYHLPAP